MKHRVAQFTTGMNGGDGSRCTWIKPHAVVSLEKQFKKSPALDTGQEFTITAGVPGTYTYFCSVHPKMTGTIVVEKSQAELIADEKKPIDEAWR
jgi:plastocyanin